MDPKHHTLEIFLYIPQFQIQFLFRFEKLCEIRFSLFCEFCASRFRRFFLVRHCYYSFLRATESRRESEASNLSRRILRESTECQRYHFALVLRIRPRS